MKIYTKTGDNGTTQLIGGRRVSKSHPRVEAYGSVDELTAQTAYLRDNMEGDAMADYRRDLARILSELMNVAAVLATDDGSEVSVKLIPSDGIKYLEQRIDYMQGELPPITKFTIPGGHPLVSLSHIARTVCRRAERNATAIENLRDAEQVAIQYLNRLSDYFYNLGRVLTQEYNAEEILWVPDK